ncbi:Putative transposase [Fuerstiella marisgermanici]|uniref:Transposase n=1 Tax=Fuerstiella marisgermanici TaxID=1891926 RepID=A0A1P8WNT4_9PLAN|nr:Putative transposase [Fuerstiella marisgermanici]
MAGYLAKYVCGSPISGRRIERVDSDEIAFWYRDHRDGQQKLMRVTPHEFLKRWFEHVPPKGQRMIRRSGLYANCNAGWAAPEIRSGCYESCGLTLVLNNLPNKLC